jgi:excinuclease UvrABC nuclease subunit
MLIHHHFQHAEVINEMERAAQQLPMETAEEIRQEISHILKHFKAQKNNAPKAEHDALMSVRESKDATCVC